MSCWDARNNGTCQNCKTVGPSAGSRQQTVEFLRCKGWHHAQGVTYGLQPYEVLLCRGCVTEERKRAIRQPVIQQDALPIDWDQLEAEAQGDGQQWR